MALSLLLARGLGDEELAWQEETVCEEARLYSADLPATLLKMGWVQSKGEARRLITQGGLRHNGRTVEGEVLAFQAGDVLNKGKRFWARLLPSGEES